MNEIDYLFSKHRAKNAQHTLFGQDVLAAVTEEVATKYGFLPQWTAFSTAVNAEANRFKPAITYVDTATLESKDKQRDTVYRLNKGKAKLYYECGTTPEEVEAGRIVSIAFDESENAHEQDLASETATLRDLVAKLRVEPYLSALSTIGMEGAPGAIEEANEAFHEVYTQRTAEERDRAAAPDMKTLRAATDAAFDALAKAINALYAVNEMVGNDEETRVELGEVIADVNAVVVRFRKIMGGSTGKPDEGGEENPSTEPENPDSETPDTENPDGETPGTEEPEEPRPGVDADGDGSPEVV